MLRGMTFRQFCEWRAYGDVEPFDETRADLRSAQIVATLLNIHHANRKGIEPRSPEDVVLRFGPKPADEGTPASASAEKTAKVERQRSQIRGVLDALVRGQQRMKARGNRGR